MTEEETTKKDANDDNGVDIDIDIDASECGYSWKRIDKEDLVVRHTKTAYLRIPKDVKDTIRMQGMYNTRFLEIKSPKYKFIETDDKYILTYVFDKDNLEEEKWYHKLKQKGRV